MKYCLPILIVSSLLLGGCQSTTESYGVYDLLPVCGKAEVGKGDAVWWVEAKWDGKEVTEITVRWRGYYDFKVREGVIASQDYISLNKSDFEERAMKDVEEALCSSAYQD